MSCSALGALRNAESGQILTVTLEKDPSADVRERAAYALGTLKSRNAIPALTKVLRGADSESVRCAAGVALGDIGGGDSVSALQSALADGSSHVRDTCERSLEMLGMLTLPLPEQVYAPMDRTEYEDYLGRNRVEHKVEKGGRIYFEVTHPVHGPAKGGGRVYYSEREWYWTLPR
jgi:hypothetical protein